jgi:DNA-binding PadR family transcriptional regulator
MSPRKIKTDQQRLPKKRRAKTPPRFYITERDVSLVRAVLDYRFLYTKHILWLQPPGTSKQNIQTRLRNLFHNGYLDRLRLDEPRGSEKLVYALTEKGALLLAETQGVPREAIPWERYMNKVSPTHFRHLLEINEVLLSFQLVLSEAQARREIAEFVIKRGEPKKDRLPVQLRAKDGRRVQVAIVPDAYVAIKFDARNYGIFFVEVDRATMSTGRWQEKVQVYREYNHSEHLRDKFRAEWCIVLTVAPSDKRIASLAEKTVALGGRRGFWFTTANQIAPDTAGGRIWVRASDLFDTRNEAVLKLKDVDTAPHVGLADAFSEVWVDGHRRRSSKRRIKSD